VSDDDAAKRSQAMRLAARHGWPQVVVQTGDNGRYIFGPGEEAWYVTVMRAWARILEAAVLQLIALQAVPTPAPSAASRRRPGSARSGRASATSTAPAAARQPDGADKPPYWAA
jgi:hypothetical protein